MDDTATEPTRLVLADEKASYEHGWPSQVKVRNPLVVAVSFPKKLSALC